MATLNAQNSETPFFMSVAGHVVPVLGLSAGISDYTWRTAGAQLSGGAPLTPSSIRADGTGFTFGAGLVPTGGTVGSIMIDLFETGTFDVFISVGAGSVVGGLPALFPTTGTNEEKAQAFWSAILPGNDTLHAANTGRGDMTGDFFQVVSTTLVQSDLTGGNDRMFAHSSIDPGRILQRSVVPDLLVGDSFLVKGTTFNFFLFAATLTGGNDEITLTGFTGLSAAGDARTVGDFGFLTGGADILVSNVAGAAGAPDPFASGPLLAGDAYEVSADGSVAGGADRITGTNYAFLPDSISGDAHRSAGFVTGVRDTIDGRAGQDRIAGDVFSMNGGTVWGGGDFIRGGVDSDVIAGDVYEIGPSLGGGVVSSEPASPNAPPIVDFRGGNDTIYGDNGNDIIAGDILNGAADASSQFLFGNDTIFGGDDDDQLYGDSLLTSFSTANAPGGNDILDGGLGDDLIDGQGGNDTAAFNSVLAAVSVNLALGTASGQGADTLFRIENIVGSALADTLTGNNQFNRFTGGLGNDVIDGAGGNDASIYAERTSAVSVTLTGAALAAVSVGGVVEDRIRNIEDIVGGSGNDTLGGDLFTNAFTGGAGNDFLQGRGGVDILDGGLGSDTASYADKAVAVTAALSGAAWISVSVGGLLEDEIRFVENLIGGIAGDTLFGDSMVNAISGGLGNDVIRGGSANDVLDGGIGVDTADYGDKTFSVVATLNGVNPVVVTVNGVAEETITGFENLRGGIAADTLTGDANANQLEGGFANDILNGQANNDILIGGAGNDTLTGGSGADQFRFLTLGPGVDIITDFTHLTDDIVVSASAFGGGLAAGGLTAARLVANAAPVATQAFGQFLYETDTGRLTWDQNGTDLGGLVVIATLQPFAAPPVLTNSDFLVIA